MLRDHKISVYGKRPPLKCPCDEKSLIQFEAHQYNISIRVLMALSVSRYLCLVLKIFRFFETCKLDVSDVIYSRITNYIYKIVNISVNNRQNYFKLCMSIAIW